MFVYIAAILLSFIISNIIFECCSIKSLFYQIIVITAVYVTVLLCVKEKQNFDNKNTPLYINAPKDKNMCSSCVVGRCKGDVCTNIK